MQICIKIGIIKRRWDVQILFGRKEQNYADWQSAEYKEKKTGAIFLYVGTTLPAIPSVRSPKSMGFSMPEMHD